MRSESQQICAQGRGQTHPSDVGWDYAIEIAKGQIGKANEKIERLRVSIKVFEDMKERSEPFPGEKGLLGQGSDL